MTEPTREEITAKIEASEARVETRLVSIEGKIDRLFDRVDMSIKASEKAESAAERAEDRAGEAQRAVYNTKWNTLFLGFAIVGIFFGAWTIWAQGVEMISTLLSMPYTLEK